MFSSLEFREKHIGGWVTDGTKIGVNGLGCDDRRLEVSQPELEYFVATA